MIKTVSELKDFIVWAKNQKVKSVKIGDIEVHISDLGLIEGLPDAASDMPATKSTDLSVQPSSPRLPNGNTQATEDDEDLFWSTR